jgi:hypothetical protein
MTAPFIRIFLRYLSGVLVAKGLFSSDDATVFSDPDLVSAIEAGIGFAIGAMTEYYYYLARKFGWEK